MYIGVTSDLVKRVWEHKEKVTESFTKKYNVDKLVYYEIHENAESAITRESNLKNWKRSWKLKLISDFNQNWEDLYFKL